MLRAAVKASSELGQKAQVLMESGQLVPDDVVLGRARDVGVQGVHLSPLVVFLRTSLQSTWSILAVACPLCLRVEPPG
jgi:adenylate kinase family enzyme